MTSVAIENLDAFKSWLTKTLTPICDADPQALAKYVIALIKKEKSAEELKPVCLNQLDVFLQEKTKDFVDTLFLCLKNKTYLPPPGTEPKVTPPPSQPCEPAAVDQSAPPAKDKENTNSDADDKGFKRRPDDLRNKISADDRRRSRSPLRRSPLRGRNSRERSPIKDRSPVRDRNNTRDRDRSPNREKSPFRRRTVFDRLDRRRSPDRGRPRYGGRYDPRRRRPSLPRSPGPRRSPIRRSRSPRPRSPGRPRSLSPERRRSNEKRSLSPRDRQPRSRTPPRRFRPRSWSMSSSGLSSYDGSRSRSRSKTPVRSPLPRSPLRSKTPDSRGSTPRDYSPYNRETREVHDARDYSKPPQKPRCRDYDEKGFCMRGDLCPYDHGADPVVVDDVSLPSVLQLNQAPPGPPRLPGPPPHGALGPRVMGPAGPVPARSMPIRGLLPVPRPPIAAGPLARLPVDVARPPPPPPPPSGYPSRSQASSTPPPPPGTVPIHIPPASQGYNPSSAAPMTLPPYQPEPYNPEAPSIRVPPVQGYFPGQAAQAGQGRAANFPVVQSYPNTLTSAQPMRTVQGNLVTVPTQQPKVQVPTVTEPDPQSSTSNRTVLLGKRQFGEEAKQNGAGVSHSPSKKPMFDKERLGPKRNYIANNTALELRKVPLDKNNIGSINAHFAKFGLITNLQVCYKGDPEAAVVTFATPNQAQAAYRCTEPIFNNRFVKVFWHNPDAVQPSEGEKAGQRTSVKERLGTIIPPANKLSLNNTKKAQPQQEPTPKRGVSQPTGLSKTVFNPDALPNPKPTAVSQKVKDDHTKRTEYIKKKAEIQKRKHQLLQEQLKQQKSLISKLEDAKNMSPEDKKSILKTIKVLADSIEKLKSELLQKPASQPKAAPKPSPAAPTVEKTAVTVDVKAAAPAETTPTPTSPEEKAKAYLETKQKTQKAILDTELDIMSKQNSGADTSALRQKVAALKREAAALGLLGQGRGRGLAAAGPAATGRGGAFIGRGRGSYTVSHVIDRRPKQLYVTHYTHEEKEAVVSHLSSFGEIESIVHDDAVPSMMIDFKTRQDAENAARDGQAFKNKRLVMSWHKFDSPAKPARPPRSTSMELLQGNDEEEEEEEAANVASSVSLGLDDPDLEGIDEDALLGLDDEDEEEDADKSWKRER